MVEYLCYRCGYVGKQKNHLKNHLNRKYVCKPVLDDISIEEMLNYYFLETTPKQHPNDTQTTPKQHPNSSFLKNETAPNNTQTTHKRHPNNTQTTPNNTQFFY